MQANPSMAVWSGPKKALFRLCSLFFTLFIFFNPNAFFPFVNEAYEFYIKPFHQFIPWLGEHALHLSYPITSFTNGSGDTTFDWVVLLLIVVLSLLGCIVWTLLDRRRANYHTQLYWLNVLVRYYFAFNMLNYGVAKLAKSQFPFPSPYGLMESYGNSSPMHLAWSFLGYSRGYNYFMGFAEITSAALLLFRRTIRVGAIVSLVVAANIMAINYSFDVCVKLLSTVLVIMAVYLLLQGWEHQLNFFFLNREARPESLTRPGFRKRWINKALRVTKYVVLIGIFGLEVWAVIDLSNDQGAPKPPLFGVYNVESFVRGRDTLLPLTTDTTRWRRLMVSNYGRTAVQLMNDTVRFYTNTPDTVKSRLRFTDNNDTARHAEFAYTQVGREGLLLAGRWRGDSIRVMLKRFDTDSLLLVRRGFHLINERPFNR